MNLFAIIEEKNDVRAKYGYYRSLGYTDYAAAIFSALTYGDERLAEFMHSLTPDKTRTISDLAAWLQDQPEETPLDAIYRDYEEKHRRPAPEPAEYRESFSRSFSASKETKPCPREADNLEACLMAPTVAYKAEESPTASFSVDCSYNSPVFHSRMPGPAKASASKSRRSPLRALKEALSTDAYETIEEKSAKSVFTSPTSTFRMTTSNASMGIVFNQIRNGRRVNMDQVRIEEVLNSFDYDAEAPVKQKFSISTELLPKGNDKKLLYIHAQAVEEAKDHQNIVLLLDVSGSMLSKKEVTQEAVATIFSKLKAGDRISLVTYSSKDETVLDGYEIRSEQDKETLMGILYGITIYGGTFGSAGIETAYVIGAKHYRPDWNNQVILITDGDLNFGITSKNGLEKLIEKKKKVNLFLSVIGTGLYNLKDDKLQVLSKHGNGTYCVVNSFPEVDESVNRHYTALTNIIAKDVKAQVEFNPRFVKEYRLLGYENRDLNHEDFTNDAVISEPYGSGGHGVALYELEMADPNSTPDPDLKYQKPVLTDLDELGTVKIRYREPLSDVSCLIEETIPNTDKYTGNARLAYLLYCISEKLRGSDKLDQADENYLEDMRTGEKYREFAGTGTEKLELLLSELEENTDRGEDTDFDLWF